MSSQMSVTGSVARDDQGTISAKWNLELRHKNYINSCVDSFFACQCDSITIFSSFAGDMCDFLI